MKMHVSDQSTSNPVPLNSNRISYQSYKVPQNGKGRGLNPKSPAIFKFSRGYF